MSHVEATLVVYQAITKKKVTENLLSKRFLEVDLNQLSYTVTLAKRK